MKPDSLNFPTDISMPVSPQREPMPDIAVETAATHPATLDWVGMSNVEAVINLPAAGGQPVIVPAAVDVMVSMDDPEAKGIHMSRLYLATQDELERDQLSPQLIERLLNRLVQSHHQTSGRAVVRVRYQHLVQRPALASHHRGWRHYPVCIEGTMINDQPVFHLEVQVAYSSTCPCSAALARQAIQEQFQAAFAHHRWLSVAQVNDWLRRNASDAIPHSQRSRATVRIHLSDGIDRFPITALVDEIETALATPVQAAVRRVDELEFARLTGTNLMFVEDAARVIKRALDSQDWATDYRIQVEHFESLHPHDAVAVVVKGVKDGMLP